MKRPFFYLMQYLMTRRRNRYIRKAITPSMKVIGDVGCGHFASKYANILIDKLGIPDVQRGHLEIYKGKKKFYNVDLNVFPYPFPDKYFDFTICIAVLEHLTDPVRACAELSRISKAGYVEVPLACVDIFIRNADSMHESLCSWDGEHLLFMNRKEYLSALRPCGMNIVFRFVMQLQAIRFTWYDRINARAI